MAIHTVEEFIDSNDGSKSIKEVAKQVLNIIKEEMM